MKKELKVYNAFGENNPSLLLSGQWLKAQGFRAGDKVDVECNDGRLVISKVMENESKYGKTNAVKHSGDQMTKSSDPPLA